MSIVILLIAYRAWYCDDAFITFRTLDNFINGYLLTWNTYERVQAYTHPLWLFLLIPFYAITHEIYLTVIIVSIILSGLALFFLFHTVNNKNNLILPLFAMTGSNAYINYSTSGLENSLLNLLFSIFIYLYTKKENSLRKVMFLSLTACLFSLTRLDAILLVLPSLFVIIFDNRHSFIRTILSIFIGFSPLFFWEIFSLFYYGFPLPNTFYAKLSAGVPLPEYLYRGGGYFWDTLTRDPITCIGLISGCFAIFFLPRNIKPFSVGAVIYMAYVFFIGGDFMSGRMYATLFFVCIILISMIPRSCSWTSTASLSVVLIIIGLMAECPTIYLSSSAPLASTRFDIMDERRYYFGGTGLFRNNQFNTGLEMDDNVWNFGGYTWIARERALGNVKDMGVLIRNATGFIGFFGGPYLKIVDDVGLSDPLIARLPAIKDPNWKVGHLFREVPEGYPESIVNPEFLITNNNIQIYNQQLKVLTQRDLFQKGRIEEIIKFNIGFYDDLLK